MVDDPACDVCSRTILKGEQLHEYVSPQGERFGVCVLCRSRAEAWGWIPAEQYGAIAREPPARARRGQALRRRLGKAASRVRGRPGLTRDPAEGDEPGKDALGDQSRRGEVAEAARPDAGSAGTTARPGAGKREVSGDARAAAGRRRPQPKRRSERPAAPGVARPSQTPQPRLGPAAIKRRAVERFNSSEGPRKVAGLIRSLGEPRAAVRPDPRRQQALVTVAWELSWYQWEVGANGGDESVREVAKGDEVSELDEHARRWNADVAEDGTLRLHSAGRGQQPSAKSA